MGLPCNEVIQRIFIVFVALSMFSLMAYAMPRQADAEDVSKKYMSLEMTTTAVQVLYVWIDGSGQTLRCKTKTVYGEPQKPSDVPVWNFDGSSTGQADGKILRIYFCTGER